MNPTAFETLNSASTLELFHLATVVERLMSDPARIIRIRQHLNLGKRVRFVDSKSPGAALQLRTGTVVAMKTTQLTVQDDQTRVRWTLPYAAIEIPTDQQGERLEDQRDTPRAATVSAPKAPTRDDFHVGDRVSFEDRHLQIRVGVIVRINRKTVTIDCDNEAGWRVPFGLLRHVIDLPTESPQKRAVMIDQMQEDNSDRNRD